MADPKKQILSADEVNQAINGLAQPAAAQPQAGASTNPNGYQQITPLGENNASPVGSAWRNVQMTGNARTDYKQLLGSQPMAYQNPYATQQQQTLNNLLGQQPFNYDVNTDALYQQIKDNYIKQGRQAMMNTQGAAAALTGGYGNSYGAMAGQQAYQESLGNLSAQIPELYQLAYQKYLNGEQSQRQNLEALRGLDETEYGRYQAEVQQYDAKLEDAYKKVKAASGGSGLWSFDKLMKYAYSLYSNDPESYNSQSGLHGDDAVAAAEQAGMINKKNADALREMGKYMTEKQILDDLKNSNKE